MLLKEYKSFAEISFHLKKPFFYVSKWVCITISIKLNHNFNTSLLTCSCFYMISKATSLTSVLCYL